VTDRLAWNPWPVDEQRLVTGLEAAVRTPLGPLFARRALVDLAPSDRLDEMSFDLTLGEGGNRSTDADIGRLLLDHLPADDPLGPWAASLTDGPFSAVLAGHLTGSIDLVARVRHDDGIERFVVSDYKTNRLASRGVTPTAAHFQPDQLPAAMAEHQYPLQALLYSVALHRYLRWRLPGYDPAVHLGGTAYLFVRGMVGPDTPTTDGVPNGVFSWRPASDLIIELSDLLDGSTRTRAL
ncbi:MAG: exodeoxyribonuclease V, partial [Acidimicrobiaceae bacterium]|nr:exodeoxyribonuclease V [Acidimicrobiaceae bacterium]